MCEVVGPAIQAQTGILKPEGRLADLIREHLEVSVSDAALRVFIRANWAEIARLAHAIAGHNRRDSEVRAIADHNRRENETGVHDEPVL